MKKLLALVLAAIMALSCIPALADDEPVTVSMYLYGGEGVANQDILDALNVRLVELTGAKLEIRYLDWGDIATKYPLLFVGGEEFDMAYGSASGDVPLSKLATEGGIIEITDEMLAEVPTLRDSIPETAWNGVKVGGKIYGVPCLYSEFTPYGFAYRTDLLEKYGLEKVTSWETMVAYMDAVLAEGYPAINGNADDANSLYRMFTDSVGEWIYAPGIPQDQTYLVASEADPMNLVSPVYSDEFVTFCKAVKEWSEKGYLANDALAATTGGKDNTNNGLSSGYITHMPDWTGCYGTVQKNLPGVYVDWWSPAVDNGKVINKAGADNSTMLSATSKHPIESLKVIEALMFDEECYRYFQYGIYGRQYEIVDGISVTPEGYDSAVDGGGFCGWALRNDEYNLPYASEDPVRYELIEAWKQVCIESPYVGFNLDTSMISNELAAISDVNAQYGRPLLLGKVADVDAAVEEYRNMLEIAGLETVIAEVKTQLEAFYANK